jgi:hypothetical protein
MPPPAGRQPQDLMEIKKATNVLLAGSRVDSPLSAGR